MQMTDRGIAELGQAAEEALKNHPDAYEKDGLLYCKRCNSPLQAWVKGPAYGNGNRPVVLMPVRCECVKEKMRLEDETAKRADFERNMKTMRQTIGMRQCKSTFADDKNEKSKVGSVCRRYVEEWDKMRKENLGILFYGSKGTGKTFYAECIVNALAERGIMTGFTTTAELMMRMQGTEDREGLIEALSSFSLLVIDDLDAERETSFGFESVYNVINTRYRSGRPTIVTTNMDMTDMKNETDIRRGRIYDRIIEMCPIAIEMRGASKRTEKAEERKQMAREFLRGTNQV